MRKPCTRLIFPPIVRLLVADAKIAQGTLCLLLVELAGPCETTIPVCIVTRSLMLTPRSISVNSSPAGGHASTEAAIYALKSRSFHVVKAYLYLLLSRSILQRNRSFYQTPTHLYPPSPSSCCFYLPRRTLPPKHRHLLSANIRLCQELVCSLILSRAALRRSSVELSFCTAGCFKVYFSSRALPVLSSSTVKSAIGNATCLSVQALLISSGTCTCFDSGWRLPSSLQTRNRPKTSSRNCSMRGHSHLSDTLSINLRSKACLSGQPQCNGCRLLIRYLLQHIWPPVQANIAKGPSHP